MQAITQALSLSLSLYNYTTGEFLRAATSEEAKASTEAAKYDGGAGVILVDGVSCYVA